MTDHELQRCAERQIGSLASWPWSKTRMGYLTDAGWLEALKHLREERAALRERLIQVDAVVAAIQEVVWRNEREDVVDQMESKPEPSP